MKGRLSKYTLYSSVFCPFSRKVRFVLDEMEIDYQTTEVKFWLRSKEFLLLNPACEVPVLKNLQTGEVLCDSYLICEYVCGAEREVNELNYFDFLGLNLREKYEIQRLHMWFDKKFYYEVSRYIVEEIFLSSFAATGHTNTNKLSVALKNLDLHMGYMEHLLGRKRWLASESFSIADIAAATELSVIDYLGHVEWSRYPKLKDWYRVIKSKKGFRNILFDRIPGFRAHKHYSELDF
ncbi:MAG: glutathione S-transferase family protein, partial [Rickettsiales bacterium]|jgi:glutathione S-transferase|nr:glutathione S-transferase family protein [Rickettsiales bacterium]